YRRRPFDPGCPATAATCAIAGHIAIAPASESACARNAGDAPAASALTHCHEQRFTWTDCDEASDIRTTPSWIGNTAATSSSPRLHLQSGDAIRYRERLGVADI